MKKVYLDKTYEDDSKTAQDGVVLYIGSPVPSNIKELKQLSWSLGQVAKYLGVNDTDISLSINYEPDYQNLYIKGLFEVGDVPDQIGCINFQFCTDDEDNLA